MRISLFHNQKAGDNTSLSWIRELIETSGHDVVRVFDREAAFGELMDERTELVVAAGGDGTVAAAARLVCRTLDSDSPFSRLGTANNIAKSSAGRRIERATGRRLGHGHTPPLSILGVARGPWGERRFLEGVGVGLIPATIASISHEPRSTPATSPRSSRARRFAIAICLSHLEPASFDTLG